MVDEREHSIEPRCLSRKQAASYVGVSINTFTKMVKEGDAPQPIKITERRVVWDKKALDSMIDGLTGF